MKEYINLFIADDHQIVIDGLTLLLKSEEKINIIGTANDGLQAYNAIQKLKPDIALIDLRMPEKDGLEIIKSLVHKTNTKFIILSMHQDKRILQDAINYNTYAYLLKNVGKQELIDTIFRVYSGEKTISLHSETSNESKTFLTPRELDVLKLILTGHSSSQIAEKLNLSLLTVGTHRKSINRKTRTNNPNMLIKWAEENEID